MLTLKQEIDQVKTELRLLENSVNIIKKQLQHLEDSRAYCDHTWDEDLKDWEYEGRRCTGVV